MKKYLAILFFSVITLSACSQGIQQNDNQQDQERTGQNEQAGQTTRTQDNSQQSAESTIEVSQEDNPEIMVETPAPGQTVSSPVMVKGKALGTWFFEGVLPVSMEDPDGNLLSAAPARALDDWMTEDFVEFEAQLDFNPGNNENAVIVIKNDNPSGLSENAKKFEIPIQLK